jgi:hypothetical protein
MALDVITKDCTQLNDGEFGELADLCAESARDYEAGMLSKLAEEWVLVTLVREGHHLRAFSFSTLERIGGTPSVLLGLVHVKRAARRNTYLNAVMSDNYRRALMAFPDEDVLLGSRLLSADGFEAYKALTDINPRPGHKSSGEERAWGRRLAKRFGVEGGYDDKHFVAKGDGSVPLGLDHESLKPQATAPDVRAQFDTVKVARGDSLIAFGWIMAEDLLRFA